MSSPGLLLYYFLSEPLEVSYFFSLNREAFLLNLMVGKTQHLKCHGRGHLEQRCAVEGGAVKLILIGELWPSIGVGLVGLTWLEKRGGRKCPVLEMTFGRTRGFLIV